VQISFCSAKTLVCHGWKIFVAGLVTYASTKYLRKIQMVMKTDNVNVNWSNNIAIHGSQTQHFFHQTKVVTLEKRYYKVNLSLVSTIRLTKLKVKTTATTLQI